MTATNPIDAANPSAAAPSTPEDDAALFDFGRRWYVFGGGAAESIFVEFGLSSNEFFRRLQALLTGERTVGVDQTVVADMLTVCRKRLWLGE